MCTGLYLPHNKHSWVRFCYCSNKLKKHSKRCCIYVCIIINILPQPHPFSAQNKSFFKQYAILSRKAVQPQLASIRFLAELFPFFNYLRKQQLLTMSSRKKIPMNLLEKKEKNVVYCGMQHSDVGMFSGFQLMSIVGVAVTLYSEERGHAVRSVPGSMFRNVGALCILQPRFCFSSPHTGSSLRRGLDHVA